MLRTLFSPLNVNGLVIPNRMLMNGLHLGMERAAGGHYEALARFYARRAQGGVGLIVTGGCSPNAAGCAVVGGMSIEDDALIPEHAKITGAVHAEGGRIALQVLHFGREAFHGDLVSASNVRAHHNLYRPRALASDEVWQTVADFGAAARRAREAGYDAIEVVGSQGFLLHQFLGKHTNLRTDEWGGDIDGRLRFVREVLSACRAQAGADFPIIFRLPALDLLDSASSREEVLAILGAAREARVDMVNVGIGWHESRVPTISMNVPRAAFALVAGFVKRHAPDLLVAVSNRINDPRVAEALLLSETADLVAIGRPLLADPDFPAKARDGRFAAINTCIACNQECLDHALFGKATGCTVNPACGTAMESGLERSGAPARFAVVGGGIAGMVAATTLAERGHRVDLFERRFQLGGQMALAANIPGKSEFAESLRYYHQELLRHRVNIHLGSEVTRETLSDGAYSRVIVATGVTPRRLDVESDDSIPVLSYQDLLEHELPLRFPVIVVGSGGIAADVAHYLKLRQGPLAGSADYLRAHLGEEELKPMLDAMARERRVIILQRSWGGLAAKVGATTRWSLLQKLKKLGVEVFKGARLAKIANGIAEIEQDGKTVPLAAACIVVAIGQEPNGDILELVRQSGIPYTQVGGANPSLKDKLNLTHSIRDAYDLGLNA